MRNIFYIIFGLLLVSCGQKSTQKNNSIIGLEFQKFNQIEQLSTYTKVSDTVLYEDNYDPKYGILHLQDQTNNLVLFKSVTTDSSENRSFKILDTLVISNLAKSERITIGYCQISMNMDENLIAIVDKTDSLFIKRVKTVWQANTTSKKIESLSDLSEIKCYNEWAVQ